MSTYVSRMFHKLKEFIWTQLGLGYTMKQIYDKHKEIWWAQVNAGEWMMWDDFLPMTPRYHLLGLEAQEGHLALAQKPGTFHLVMGLCSFWWCLLFLRCMWSEWDSSPFQHRDPDTYVASSHAPIWSQRAYFYGCHVWHQWCEVPPIHIDGVWFSLHKGANCLGYLMFHYKWCPIETLNITIGCTSIF